MQQPQFDLLSQLQQQPMCRWPICNGLLALLVGLTVINCGASAPARVFGRHLAFAEVQRDARRDDEPAGVTHWKPSTVDLGKRCDPRRWSFVEFPAPGADVAVDARTMGLFLVCFDNNDLGAALAGSVARGGTVDDEDVVSVNNLVFNFITHPDAANVFSVFDDVSSDDVQALASGSPPAPSTQNFAKHVMKCMGGGDDAADGAAASVGECLRDAASAASEQQQRGEDQRRRELGHITVTSQTADELQTKIGHTYPLVPTDSAGFFRRQVVGNVPASSAGVLARDVAPSGRS
jgi:hypothetical protein